METLAIVFAFVMLAVMICLVVMVGIMLRDTTGNAQGETVYILRVSPNGDVKIKKYRGKVKYWSDLDG